MAIDPADVPIIDHIIEEEKGLAHDPDDKGGLTFEGISQASNPDLFVNGIPTEAQVRQRYEDRYIKGPGFDKVQDPKLKSLLVDWGVNSGPAIAIKALQQVVGVEADGVIGPATMEAISEYPADKLVVWVVAERVKMIGRLVSKNQSQAKFVSGWLNRAVEWLSY